MKKIYPQIIPFFIISSLCILLGCEKNTSLEEARLEVKRAQGYYEKAVLSYKNLLATNKGSGNIHFELAKLYYSHGDFKSAAEEFKIADLPESKKFLGLSFYFLGNFVDALEIFSKEDPLDDEGKYYYGLTCEKLNLFDQALGVYSKIKDVKFAKLAKERKGSIEKAVNLVSIKDLDPQVANIIAQAPAAEKYPQAGALILSCKEQVQITDSKQEISSLHYIIKILNDRGKQDFAETQIEYDSTFEKVQLEYARVIKPDGSVVDVGSRHIRDVSKYLNFPLYSNSRVFIISFPEIAQGVVIEYKLKILRNKMINDKDFVLNYPLQTQEPVIKADFSLDLPENLALHINIINDKYNDFSAKLKPELQKNGKREIYHWSFKNIPQIIPEANMSAAVEINPTILFSSFDSWEAIYTWWWGLAQDKISADKAIKNKVKDLTKDLTLEEEKIRAIYNFCAKDIRYVAVEYGQAGYEPHKAEDIFKNKYGDCKDQAILLVTMLQEAGLKGYPVLIPTNDCYNLNPNFPSMMFDHAIAAVELNGKLIFMDPTAETCSFGDLPGGDQNRRVVVLSKEGYKIETTPLFPARHNLVNQATDIKINNDESIMVKKTVNTSGVFEQGQRYWLLYTPPQLVEEALKEKIQDVAIGSKLINYSVKNLDNLNLPVVLNYEFSGNDYLTSAGNLRMLPQLANVDNSLAAKDTRKYPIDFNILDSREISYIIDIPEGFKVKYLPQNLNEDSPWLKFEVEYKNEGSKIIFKQKSELKKTTVSEQEYIEFKQFFQSLAKKIKQRAILEKAK